METLYAILNTPEVQIVYQVARALFILVDIFFLVIFIYATKQLLHFRPKFVWDPREWQKYVKPPKKHAQSLANPVVENAWKKVQDRVKEGTPAELRLAVIEADGAVDETLKRMGLAGETFADRLGKVSVDKYPSSQGLWEAHRLRNNLVHTPDFEMHPAKAEAAVQAYEAFLKEVKAI